MYGLEADTTFFYKHHPWGVRVSSLRFNIYWATGFTLWIHYTTVQKFGVTQTISCFPWKLTLLFIKWVEKWIENIVKTLTRLEMMNFIWNNNFVLQTFVKEFSICSNYSRVDLWHYSCQFVEVIWRNFTPCFLKHLPQVGLAWWALLTYHTVKLLPQQLNRVEIWWLRWPLQTEYQLTASSLISSCIVWRCALGHCPVVGGNWLQSSAVHRVWHGVAKWSDCEDWGDPSHVPWLGVFCILFGLFWFVWALTEVCYFAV